MISFSKVLSRKRRLKFPGLLCLRQVDNAIAWRLLDEFRRQNRMGLCRLTASGLRVTCWAQATFNGEPLFIDNPDSYRVPSTGLLSVSTPLPRLLGKRQANRSKDPAVGSRSI